MIIIDYDTAVKMVQQIYPQASDPMLGIELEATRGERNYRPYLVAAKFILTEYRQITKAEEVTFAYNRDQTVTGLLNRQRELDKSDNIPEGLTVDDILMQLLVIGTTTNYLGVNVF